METVCHYGRARLLNRLYLPIGAAWLSWCSDDLFGERLWGRLYDRFGARLVWRLGEVE